MYLDINNEFSNSIPANNSIKPNDKKLRQSYNHNFQYQIKNHELEKNQSTEIGHLQSSSEKENKSRSTNQRTDNSNGRGELNNSIHSHDFDLDQINIENINCNG